MIWPRDNFTQMSLAARKYSQQQLSRKTACSFPSQMRFDHEWWSLMFFQKKNHFCAGIMISTQYDRTETILLLKKYLSVQIFLTKLIIRLLSFSWLNKKCCLLGRFKETYSQHQPFNHLLENNSGSSTSPHTFL